MNAKNYLEPTANNAVQNSFLTNDDNKMESSPLNEPDKFVKNNKKYKISTETLFSIIKEAEKRTFTEEIDELENLGGMSFLERGVDTDFKDGIKSSDLDVREAEYSHNRRVVREQEGFFALLLNALGDFTLRILILCSIVSIAIEVGMADDDHRTTAWIDGFAIMVAVLISSSVQAENDYQKEKQFQALNKIADDKKMFSVIRDGKVSFLHHNKLLVGDIVILSEGMEIPADGILIEGSEVSANESAMTGETEPMQKASLSECLNRKKEFLLDITNKKGSHSIPSPILLSGSKILQGEGKFLVVVVGDQSCLGRIQSKLETETESTPLQEKLEHLARNIGKFGLISATLILIVLLIRFSIDRIKHDNFYKEEHWKELVDYLLISITVIVVAIPEGLPLSVVISLAYSVKKMLKDNNLVRRLHACETMGGADMVCSDKTGTLTQNEMTFASFYNDKKVDIETFKKISIENYFKGDLKNIFFQTAIINSSAILKPSPKGSSTEIALLKFLEDRCELKSEDIRGTYEIIQKFPFNSSRKRMGCIILQNEILGLKKRLVEKGASEILLEACDFVHSFDNETIEPMNHENKNKIIENIESMASNALRTLILAYKDLNGTEDLTEKDSKGVYKVEKSGLIFFGLIGIKDILRREVPAAIQQCKKSGITVRMVTGDNKITARAIAIECGIITQGDENSLVLEGTEFIEKTGGIICNTCKINICNCPTDEKTAKKVGKPVRVDTLQNPEAFEKIYRNISVLARSRPEDKYTMVVALKEKGHVVAVTGDGTNDAPALKKADVGFAMGIAGTEVAREAAAIILLDDNFSSIVRAVLWGRNIFDSIRKFLQFQLTVNLVAVGITLIGAAILKQQILQPVQMLWINLIMDTFASLALATEEPSLKLLDRKPHNRNEHMISKKMFKHIVGQAIYQLVVLNILIFYGENFIPEFPDALDKEILKDNKPLTYKYRDLKEQKFIRSGRYIFVEDPDQEDYKSIEKLYGPSRHFTVVFNTFVCLQIFNFINARRIQDELNVFQGVLKNIFFLYIWLLIVLLQAILICHGSIAFHVYKWYDESLHIAGLHYEQWLICVAFGFGSLIVGFLLKILPEALCLQLGVKRSDPIHNPSKIIEMKRGRGSRKFSSIQCVK